MKAKLNTKRLKRLADAWPATFNKAQHMAMDEMLVYLHEELLFDSPVSEGTLAASWTRLKYPDDGTKVTGAVRNTQPYSKWALQGRGPGKMPPEDAIERWVHRAGIGPYESGEEREAGHTPHRATGPRKPRPAAKSRAPRRPRGDLSRREIVFLIRKSIAEHGTYRKDGPPMLVEKVSESSVPKLEEILVDTMRAFTKTVGKL